MVRVKNVIKELEAIKDRYIHGGDDSFDAKRRQAIDDAILLLTCLSGPSSTAISRASVHATFPVGQVFGTLQYNGEEYLVYLASVESHPIGRGRAIDGIATPPLCLKRKFVLVER